MEGAALIVSLPGFLPGSPVPAAMSSQQQQQQQQCLPQMTSSPVSHPLSNVKRRVHLKPRIHVLPRPRSNVHPRAQPSQPNRSVPQPSKPPRVNRSKDGLRYTCLPSRLPDAAFSFSCSFSDPQLRDLPSSPIFSYSGSKETLSGFLPMEPLVSHIPLLPVFCSPL